MDEVKVEVALNFMLTNGKYLSTLNYLSLSAENFSLVYEVPCKECNLSYLSRHKKISFGDKKRSKIPADLKSYHRAIRYQQPLKCTLCKHLSLDDHIN